MSEAGPATDSSRSTRGTGPERPGPQGQERKTMSEADVMSGSVQRDIDGAIGTITNNNPDAHNAFDDEMDLQLFSALRELREHNDVRARRKAMSSR